MSVPWLAEPPGRVVLRVHVQPRARKTEQAGVHGDRLKVRVAAPPVAGAANDALCRWLAREFAVAPSRVRIARGAGGRDKQVEVTDPARRPDWLPDAG